MIKYGLRNIKRRCPRKKRRRQRPPTLPLKFRDEVRRRHINRDARRQRQPVVDQERDLVREGHARERRRAEHGRRADRLPARPPPRHHEARHGHAFRELMKEDGDEHHHAERPRNALAMATPSKKVCNSSPTSAEVPATRLTAWVSSPK